MITLCGNFHTKIFVHLQNRNLLESIYFKNKYFVFLDIEKLHDLTFENAKFILFEVVQSRKCTVLQFCNSVRVKLARKSE